MEDKIILEELTKNQLASVLHNLEPGTMLIIDMPEQKQIVGYVARSRAERGEDKDGGTL